MISIIETLENDTIQVAYKNLYVLFEKQHTNYLREKRHKTKL